MQTANPLESNVPFPQSDEIRLRLPAPGDAARITEICQDPDVRAWTTVPSPYTAADARDWIAGSRSRAEEGGDVGCVAEERTSGRILGTVGIRGRLPDLRIADIGYMVAPDERGKGLAPLLVTLIRDWAQRAWPVERFQIHVYCGNARSERVAEKCGFQREGILRRFAEQRGVLRDVVMFAWLPGDAPAAG